MATIELKNKDREVELTVEKHIFDEDVKKRIYVAEVIKKALNQYLDYDNLQADSSNSIYKLPIVNEKLDIIDFEINSLSVHVIPTIDKAKNHNVYIPKSYKLYNCKPDVIIFVNFTKSFAKMNILGFLTDFNANSLSVPVTSLISPDELITALKKLSPRRPAAQENAIQAAKELMLAYIDSSLSDEGEQYFLKNLISSKQIRKNYKLFYALNCKFISVAKRHTSLSDDSFVAVDSVPDEDDINNTINFNTEANVESDDIPQLTNLDEDIEITDFEDNQDIVENSENDFNISDISEDSVELDENVDNPDELLNITENNEAELEEMPIAESNMAVNDIDELPSENIELENVPDEMPELDFSSLDDDEAFDLGDDGEEISLVEEEEENQQVALIDSNYNTQAILPEPEATSPTIQTYEEAAPQENNVSEEVSEATQENGDDVFSFLEEMADESQQQNSTEQTEIQQPENILPLPEEQNIQENIELQNDDSFVSDVANITEQQPVVEETQTAEENIMDANSFNNAFAPNVEQAAVNIQENVQVVQPQAQTVQPAKSSSKAAAILLAAIAIGGIGAGVYFNKDKIPFLSSSSEIQGLEQTDNNIADLPSPIVNAQGTDAAQDTKTGADNAANADGAVPPAPAGDAAPAPAPAQAQPEAAAVPAPAAKEQELPSIPKAVEPPKPKHLNDAIATALTKDFAGVRISKVSWEVSETLVNNPDVKRYLTIAGKSIKNSLSQDLMAATEPSFKDNIIVNITYKKDGTVSQIKLASSSGSSQIDEIIAKSVRDTLNYVRMPALNLNKPEYTAKLIVRL